MTDWLCACPNPNIEPGIEHGIEATIEDLPITANGWLTTLRKLLLSIHRYLGLALAGFLVIAGVTGSILAFYTEFDAWLNPALYRIEQSGEAALGAGHLAAAVSGYDERIRVTYLPLVATPRRATVVYVEAVTDPATGVPFDVPFDEVFINPVIAEVTGARLWGECCGRENIVPMMHKLHNRLFLPLAIGRPLWGYVAILWTVMAVLGLVLSWPHDGSGTRHENKHGAKPGRQRSALRRWGAAWKLKRGLNFLPMNIQLHRATGLWFWLVLLPIALSGVALGLERQVFLPVVSLLSSTRETGGDQPRPPTEGATMLVPVTDGALSFDQAIEQAERYLQSLGIKASPTAIGYSHDTRVYQVTFGNRDAAGFESANVSIAAAGGAVLGDTLTGKRSFAEVATAAPERVHSGRVAGLPGRILVFLCGWAVALLSVTGIIVWWKRR